MGPVVYGTLKGGPVSVDGTRKCFKGGDGNVRGCVLRAMRMRVACGGGVPRGVGVPLRPLRAAPFYLSLGGIDYQCIDRCGAGCIRVLIVNWSGLRDIYKANA